MPKVGMEPLRRKALIDATISAIGERGSLDVTMSEIAGRAGVSSALAHHYFGAKDELLLATMRHILAELTADTRACPASAGTAARTRLGGGRRQFLRHPVPARNDRRLARLLCRGAEIARPCAGCSGSMRGACTRT